MTIKRLELFIEYRPDQISFRLFEFRNDDELRDDIELAKGTRNVSLSALVAEAKRWQDGLSSLEGTFQAEYIEACNKYRAIAEAEGKITEDDIHAHILSNAGWGKAVIDAANKLVEGTGNWISFFSENLLNSFLPNRSDSFWIGFNKFIDTPTREALRGELDEKTWLNVPLLQIRVDDRLAAIPWWITRTYELHSLWCCRYALAVSPSLRRTHAPNIQFSTENPLHILTVTRPTFDLKTWFPITRDIAESFSADNRLIWRLVDGVLEFDTQPLPETIFKEERLSPAKFHGVDKNILDRSLNYQNKTPNLIFYQGHWKNQPKEQSSEVQPFIILHDPSPKPITLATQGTPTSSVANSNLPVPLLDVIQPRDYAESVLIMNACNSAAPLDQATYIQDYIEQHSVFIGASYPLVAYIEESSVSTLLRNIIKNKFLVHSLLEANQLEKSPEATDFNPRDLYYKAALCLFGDVRAHLFRPYDATSKDNVSQIELVLTDRWKAGFEKLNLSHSKGMTFRMDTPIDHAPTDKFSLTDKGVQIALTPLSIAIDLCRFDTGNYKILGPAFTSKGTVAIVSKSIKDLDELRKVMKARWEENRPLQAGILADRLTTTYMLHQFILQDTFPFQEKPEWLDIQNTAKFLSYHNAFSQGIGSRLDMLKDEFLDTVDISLVLNEDSKELRERGLNVIADDLETRTAKRLNLRTNDILPRGILLTRRKCLVNEADKGAIQEFCERYNERVSYYKHSDGEQFRVETPHDIPLYTYDKTSRYDLSSIKTFAETSFFGYEPFSWDNFAYKPTISLGKALNAISNLGDCLDQTKRSAISHTDAARIGRDITSFEAALQSKIRQQELWMPDDFRRLIERELNGTQQIIREGIREKLLQKVSDENLIELKFNG